jgi:hypothetical protein
MAVNVTNERGAHSIKFGFNGSQYIDNNNNQSTLTMSFNRGPTTGPIAAPASTTSGNTIAALLLGVGTGSSNPNPLAPAFSYKEVGWYAQDTWRMTRRLTLTFGLRYEIQFPMTERYNRQNWFDYDLVNPLGAKVGLPLKGGLVYSTPDDRGQTLTSYNNFAPRFSLAYKASERAVVRAGYGVSYGRKIIDATGTDGFNVVTPWVVSPSGGVVPEVLLSNPFPQGFLAPTGNTLGASTYVGLSPSAWRRENTTPYVQSYSLDVQYSMGRGSVLEVGYVGNMGHKLAWGAPVNYNQLHPKYLSLGESLNDLVPNPFFGSITTGQLSGRTVPRYQLLLPYPQFVAVNGTTSEKGASSSFNALYVKYTYRMKGGLSLLTTYQWSKAIDNASEDTGRWTSDARRDIYDSRIDYSVSGHDVPHDLVNTLVYQLPVGKGKKFGAGMKGVSEALLGGWQVSGFVAFRSGTPITLRAPNTLAAFGYAVQRPNIPNLNDLKLAQRSPDQWWNVKGVVAPGRFEIGGGKRFLPNVRIDNMRNLDTSLMKNFKFRNERLKLQFRAEAYNLFNTPLFGIPTTGPTVNLGTGAFGTVNTTFITSSREVQAALKLDF